MKKLIVVGLLSAAAFAALDIPHNEGRWVGDTEPPYIEYNYGVEKVVTNYSKPNKEYLKKRGVEFENDKITNLSWLSGNIAYEGMTTGNPGRNYLWLGRQGCADDAEVGHACWLKEISDTGHKSCGGLFDLCFTIYKDSAIHVSYDFWMQDSTSKIAFKRKDIAEINAGELIANDDHGIYEYIPDSNNNIELIFQPCSIFGGDDQCLRIYAPAYYQDRNNLGYSLDINKYSQQAHGLGINNTTEQWFGKITTISGGFAFKIDSAYVRSANSWVKYPQKVELKKSYKNAPGAFVGMQLFDYFQSNKNIFPSIRTDFEPLKCSEDMLYKITTTSPKLYSHPDFTANNNRTGTYAYFGYLDDLNKVECAKKKSNDYYVVANIYEGGIRREADFTCTSNLDHTILPLQYKKEYNNLIMLDRSDNINWWVLVRGDNKNPSCKSSLDPKASVFTLSDGANASVSANFTSADAHAGVLTRISSSDVALRFDVSGAKGAKYLVVDGIKTTPSIIMDDGKINQAGASSYDNDYQKIKSSILNKYSHSLSADSRIVAIDQIYKGTDTYLCANYGSDNKCANRFNGDNLRFYLSFKGLVLDQNFKDIKDFKVYLADESGNAYELAHDSLSLRVEQFNLAPEIELSGVFDMNTPVRFESKLSTTFADHPSMMGDYVLGRALYLLNTSLGEYRFYDSTSNLGAKSAKLKADELFTNKLGFFAAALELYYAVKDKTLQVYFASKGKNAQDYCRLGDEFDPARANAADSSGKIACSVPGRSHLKPAASSTDVKIAYNFDKEGSLNVLAGNNINFSLQLDYILRAFSIDEAIAKGKACYDSAGNYLKVSSKADFDRCLMLEGNWSDVSSAAIELASSKFVPIKYSSSLKDAALYEISCGTSASKYDAPACTKVPVRSSMEFDAGSINSDFLAAVDEACSKSDCRKAGESSDSIKGVLMRELLNQTSSRMVDNYANAQSPLVKTPANLKSLAASENLGKKTLNVNFFKESRIVEFSANFYGVSVPVVQATLWFKDAKSSDRFIDFIPNDQAAKLHYHKADGSSAEFIHQDSTCAKYSGTPCYNSAIAGQAGFENSWRHPHLVSQYNNEISFKAASTDISGSYHYERKASDKAEYVKDVINCIDGAFSCADFTVEFTRK